MTDCLLYFRPVKTLKTLLLVKPDYVRRYVTQSHGLVDVGPVGVRPATNAEQERIFVFRQLSALQLLDISCHVRLAVVVVAAV